MNYKINEEKIAWKKARGEVIVLNINTGAYYCLDEVGTSIWDGLVRNGHFKKIVDKVWREFNQDRNVIEKDVRRFIQRLEEEGLLIGNSRKRRIHS